MDNTHKAATTGLQRSENYPVAFPLDTQPLQPEEEIHLRDYWRVLLRRKWTAITFFLVVVTTVMVGTFLMVPIYRASVTIKIDKENPNVLKFKDVYEVEGGDENYYQTQYKILKSRNLAKRVIRYAKLDQNPEFAASAKTVSKNSPDIIDSTENKRLNTVTTESEIITQGLIDGFLGRLTVEPLQKSRLVKVSFDSQSPATAAEVANTVAKSFTDFNFESKFDATQQAREWLMKQLDDMKASVEKAEESLNRYAAANGIVFVAPPTGGDQKTTQSGMDLITSKLAQMSTNLVQATSERLSREALYREVQSGNLESSLVINNPAIQVMRKDYAAVLAEYSKLLTLYKPEYPQMVRLKEQINQSKTRLDEETKNIVAGIKAEYETAVKKENYSRAVMDQYKTEALKLNEKMVQYQILKRETETNNELYNGLLQRLKEIGVTASLTASNIQVLDRAEVPRTPFKPSKRKNLMIALLIGLFGGAGLAFFVEYLDNTVKTPDDIEKGVALPSLGLVPDLMKNADRSATSMIAFEDKKSPLSEAYRSIGTYIQFSSAGRPPRTMLITSARAGEGKTTTVVNTAITMAHSYGKGLIIDADLRKPQVHKVFGVDNANGLSAFLTGNIEVGNGLIQQTKIENIDVITAGIIPPNPSELLSSSRMRDLINEMLLIYAFVIIDSPPILGMSDSLVLSTLIDGVILVVKAGSTPKDAAVQAKKLLQGVNAKVLGVVLNGIREADLKYGSYSYYSYYSYYKSGYYGEEDTKEKSKKDKLVKSSASIFSGFSGFSGLAGFSGKTFRKKRKKPSDDA